VLCGNTTNETNEETKKPNQVLVISFKSTILYPF
jgi:hypothetical protein